MPGLLYLLTGILAALTLTALLCGAYLWLYAAHRRAALAVARATPLTTAGIFIAGIAALTGGGDGWLLAGLVAPAVFFVQLCLVREFLREEGQAGEDASAPVDRQAGVAEEAPKALTQAEAARRLGVSAGTVRRWRERGILRSHPGEERRLRADDVEEARLELERLRAEGVAPSRWARELAVGLRR